jgi:hypothetical protein
MALAAAVVVLAAGCSSGSSHRAALTHTTSISTSFETTTTAAPSTTRSPTTITATTTTRLPTTTSLARTAPPVTAPPTTGLHHYPGANVSCSSYGYDDLTPVRAVTWNIMVTVNWTDGFAEPMSDNRPYKPPFNVTMVGSRGTRVTVSIYWDPSQPSYRIPPGHPGAWKCAATGET